MKVITNKYGYIHGGYLFYLMDNETHKFAVDKIGECLTGNVNIYYHQPVLPSDIENLSLNFEVIFETQKTILIQTKLLVKKELYVTAMFTFIKIKKDEK